METTGRRNRKIPILTIALLLLIPILSITYMFEKHIAINTNTQLLVKQFDDLNKEIEISNRTKVELDKEIEKYSNIDTKIVNEKNRYYTNIKKLEDSIIAGTNSNKIAYLTFDDGPYYTTFDFLYVLDKYNVKATFFVQGTNGRYCYQHKDKDCYALYKEYLKYGHTIANHTYHHLIGNRYVYQSASDFINSVNLQEKTINEETGGYKTNIVRFPGGSATSGKLKNEIIEKLRENGYGWVDWTANDGDGGGLQSSTDAWNNFVKTIDSNIEVILFHDYNRYTLEILPRVIEYLRENGYILLPLFYESNMVNK